MTNLVNQRRMAASILKCGEGRIWLDPTSIEDLQEAVTRTDIRHAISIGVIQKKPEKGVSRFKAKERADERRRGRHKGVGSHRGAPSARNPSKSRWIEKVRPQRALLSELRGQKKITPKSYREFYRKVKGGMFRSRAHLMTNLKLANALKEA
jgi:large subunit ribosomal protein L19e